MSLAIDVNAVERVLLADGWHDVINESFDTDAYEFIEMDDKESRILHGGGNSGVCATGFRFQEKDHWVMGPLTAVLAVTQAS